MNFKTSILRKARYQTRISKLRTKQMAKRALRDHAIKRLELLEQIFSKKLIIKSVRHRIKPKRIARDLPYRGQLHKTQKLKLKIQKVMKLKIGDNLLQLAMLINSKIKWWFLNSRADIYTLTTWRAEDSLWCLAMQIILEIRWVFLKLNKADFTILTTI